MKNPPQKRQEFEVLNDKPYFVRQDRIECDPERYKVSFLIGQNGNVVNFSAFGLAIETNFETIDDYREVKFLIDDYEINELTLKKVRHTKIGEDKYLTAFSITEQPLDVESAISIKELNDILLNLDQTVISDLKLRESFRLSVLEIKDVLLNLEVEINKLEKNSFKSDLLQINHFEDRIASRVASYFSKTLTPLYNKLEKTVHEVPKDELSHYFDFFRKSVGLIIYQSAYAHRAYVKPKGYAGDFEMMNHIYQRELRGASLFAKCLQRYFVDEPAGKAVRNRETYLRKQIVNCIKDKGTKKPIRIMSVASGPAMEIQNLISELPNLADIEFHLLDQDLDALKFSQRKIFQIARSMGKSVNLVLHNLTIKKIIQEGLPVKNIDLIYSAGLFDYFTDPVAMFAANQLASGLSENGKLVIGNFSLNNPNQFAMDLIMDWNLIYRSVEKMKDLFGHIGKTYWLEQEDQGINFFANIEN